MIIFAGGYHVRRGHCAHSGGGPALCAAADPMTRTRGCACAPGGPRDRLRHWGATNVDQSRLPDPLKNHDQTFAHSGPAEQPKGEDAAKALGKAAFKGDSGVPVAHGLHGCRFNPGLIQTAKRLAGFDKVGTKASSTHEGRGPPPPLPVVAQRRKTNPRRTEPPRYAGSQSQGAHPAHGNTQHS